MPRFAILDTETAGLNDPVCEIAWIEIDENMNVLNRVYSLIDPEVPIKPGASGVHGITNVDVCDSPTLPEFFEYIVPGAFDDDQIIIIAHNASYDVKYVKPYIKDYLGSLCTLKLARRFFPDSDDHKLQTLRFYLGLDGGGAHSAAGDTEVTFGLLQKIVEVSGLGLAELFDLSNQKRIVEKIGFGKHKGKRLVDLPPDYVEWLLALDNLDEDIRFTLTRPAA